MEGDDMMKQKVNKTFQLPFYLDFQHTCGSGFCSHLFYL